jgi:pimeloyl-ACP methyl ester carboxylesterase
MPTVQVESLRIYFDEHGEGHPLLLITGLGSSRFGWWKQIEPLSSKFRVINTDNRDAGESDRAAAPYTIADMAKDAAGLIQSLNCRPVHVMGWSMGGFIALELVLNFPGLVDKLILAATSAGGLAFVPPSPEMGALVLPRPSENIEKRVRRIYPLIAAPGYMRSHPDDLDQIARYAKSNLMTLASYQRQLGAVMNWEGAGFRLNHIAAQTLVVHGEADPLVPYQNGKYLCTHIRGAKLLTYPYVGHLIPIEASERFNRDVMEFLC